MNVTMIGMPSSGKSTVGVMLAKRLGMNFIDVDLVIQKQTGKLLKEIIAERGNEGFLRVEGDTAASIEAENSIIAPGGSICYEDWAMEHLKSISKIIYLDVEFEEMERRIGDVKARGVAVPEGFTLRDLYDERTKLYEKYADLTIEEKGKSLGQVVNELQDLLEPELRKG